MLHKFEIGFVLFFWMLWGIIKNHIRMHNRVFILTRQVSFQSMSYCNTILKIWTFSLYCSFQVVYTDTATVSGFPLIFIYEVATGAVLSDRLAKYINNIHATSLFQRRNQEYFGCNPTFFNPCYHLILKNWQRTLIIATNNKFFCLFSIAFLSNLFLWWVTF